MFLRPPLSPFAAFVASAEATSAIVRTLRRCGIGPDDTIDLAQDVRLDALRVQNPPDTLRRRIGLLVTITRARAADYIGKRRVRRPHDAGPYGNADEHPADELPPAEARDPVDAEKQLALLRQQLADGTLSQRQIAILKGVVEGVEQSEIAADLGLSHQTVRNELHRARKTYRDKWAAYVSVAAFAGAVIVMAWLWKEKRDQAKREPIIVPDDTFLPRTPTPQERAAELRRHALHDCDLQNWSDCLKDLDAARDLDPAGDVAPGVQQARQAAAKAIKIPMGPDFK